MRYWVFSGQAVRLGRDRAGRRALATYRPVGMVWAMLAAMTTFVTAQAFEGRIDTGTSAVRPPTPVMQISEPRAGRLAVPPTRVTVFFQRFEQNLVGAGLEVWVDGVEYTESLRFWVDRAWLDLPPGFTWGPGSHTVEASIRDAAGTPFEDEVTFEIIPVAGNYIWPFNYNTPNVVANLMEDYQWFKDIQGPNPDPPYWHHGLDIRAPVGSAVHPVIGGYIAYKGCYLGCSALQHNVTVLGDDDLLWQYSHIDQSTLIAKGVGDRVEPSDVLGQIVSWCCETNDATYHHLHLNAVEMKPEEFDPDAWRALAVDPMETPPPVPAPLSADFKWHNPLLFLKQSGDLDTVLPEFTGEKANPPEIFFTANTNDPKLASAVASEDEILPVLWGDIDIVARIRDRRDVIAGLTQNPDGQPYSLGLYEVAYTVKPLNTLCNKGWIPRTVLARFDTVPGEYDVAAQDQIYLFDVFQQYIDDNGPTYDTAFEYTVRNFWYNVTNTYYGDLNGPDGFWNTDGATIQGPLFPDGSYAVTVFAVDLAGNEMTRSVNVSVDNDIDPGGFCPNRITHIVLPDMGIAAPSGGTIPFTPAPVPVSFGDIVEGGATTTIDASDWPAWQFEAPSEGVCVAIGVLDGSAVEVEYIPYLGDVILEVPAEAQVTPCDGTGPPAPFDPQAPSANPVNLRLSTRLARRPDTGEALLGAPHGFDEVDFRLVMATFVDVNAQSWLLRTMPGSTASWIIPGHPCNATPSDLDGDSDVDGIDFLTFSNCFNGALNPPHPACLNPCADVNNDGDADGVDFLTFSNCFNGALNPPACP